MAAGQLPRPGTEYGPCADPCAHTDCAATRAMAASPCRVCGQEIGYDTGFYREDSGTLVHVSARPCCLQTGHDPRCSTGPGA
jgi:hypothetical protein